MYSDLSNSFILDRVQITGHLDLNTPAVVLQEILDSLSISYDTYYTNGSNDYVVDNPDTRLSDDTAEKHVRIEDNHNIMQSSSSSFSSLIGTKIIRSNSIGNNSIYIDSIMSSSLLAQIQDAIDFIHTSSLITIDMTDNECWISLATFVNPYAPIDDWTKTNLISALKFILQFRVTINNTSLYWLMKEYKFGSPTNDEPRLLNSCILYRLCKDRHIPLEYHMTQEDMYLLLTTDVLSTISPSIMSRLRTSSTTINLESIKEIAIKYKIDISMAENPTVEFNYILGLPNEQMKFEYIPKDKILFKLYILNRHLLNLTHTFNPRLSREYYRDKYLRQLIKVYGILPDDNTCDDLYTLLQSTSRGEHFRLGLHPSIQHKTDTDIKYLTISDIPIDEVLSFGIDDDIHVYCVSEINHLFMSTRMFKHPYRKWQTFTPSHIRQLKYLCTMVNSGTWIKLGKTIAEVEQLNRAIHENTLSFVKSYNDMRESTKTTISSCLTLLLELGYYMRGWSGHNELPPIEGVNESMNSNERDILVTEAIYKLESEINQLSNPSTFLDLLLVWYSDGEFRHAIDPSEGINIRDRLRIVKENKTNGPSSSCIRLTSNYFMSSAYQYIVAIGKQAPFNIGQMVIVG